MGIPELLDSASNIKFQTSLANDADSSSPKKPTKSNCARRGSGPSPSEGKNKLIAVEETISSSNPSIEVTFCSIHCVKTGLLTFSKLTFFEKFFGNRVDLRALLRARASETDAVPLMDGMLYSRSPTNGCVYRSIDVFVWLLSREIKLTLPARLVMTLSVRIMKLRNTQVDYRLSRLVEMIGGAALDLARIRVLLPFGYILRTYLTHLLAT